MALQPCCCMSLDKGVKILSIISFLMAVAFIIEDVVLILRDGCLGVLEIKKQYPEFGDVKLETAFNDAPDRGNSTLIGQNLDIKLNTKYEICHMELVDLIVSGVWIATWTGDVILSIMLLYGAFKRSIKLCSIWFHIRCAILVFRVIFLIIYIIAGLPVVWKVPVIVMLVFRIYSLWIVSHFIDEMTIEQEAKQRPRVSVTSSKADIERYGSMQGMAVNRH